MCPCSWGVSRPVLKNISHGTGFWRNAGRQNPAGALPVDEASGIAKQIAEALEAADEKGITHRDLKPANIKITAAGRVKVIDSGLAKAYDQDFFECNVVELADNHLGHDKRWSVSGHGCIIVRSRRILYFLGTTYSKLGRKAESEPALRQAANIARAI